MTTPDGNKVYIQRADLDRELRGVKKDTLQKMLQAGWLHLRSIGEDYGVSYRCRGLGGGPVAANAAYWLVKTVCYGTAATGAGAAVITSGGTALAAATGATAAIATAGATTAASAVAGAIVTSGGAAVAAEVTAGAVVGAGGFAAAATAVEAAAIAAGALFAALPIP